MSSEDFRKSFTRDRQGIDATLSEAKRGRDEVARVENVLQNTPKILDDLDAEFCKRTKLNSLDVAVMFVAVGLQVARQYLLTKFPARLDDQTAAKSTRGHIEEHSNRQHRLYNPSLEEIITNPVPFDANIGANGALSGGGQMGHRVMAIGHDPILGLIFGTANIATSTLTTANFDSYHIYTNNSGRDFFKNAARTDLVMSYTMNKMLSEGIEGKVIVGASLAKEIIHLKSDLNTKNSLPLPVVSAINPQFASKLASYGFDMANVVAVGKQASLAMLINSLIAMFHMLFCPAITEMEQKLYEVKTRKILTYSNLIASSANLLAVGLTDNLQLLDLGGLCVTIYRLITDVKFIRAVKREFIFGSYRDIIMGDF